MELLEQPVAGAEFVALDTETNGLGGELCELTEVGAVLVGGGELHETFDSLVRPERPLARGIQRFTGITQAMVDGAPAPADVLPEVAELLRGRVLVAHSAGFDRRVLRQAFERAGLDWPRPPGSARCSSPAASRRWRGDAGWRRSRTRSASRWSRFTGRCPTRSRALECSARSSRGSARMRSPSGRRSTCCARAGASARRSRGPGSRPPSAPTSRTLPDDPGVYVFRDDRGRPLYVGKSVSLRSRARAHFCAPAGWTERAEIVDYRPTNSELGALVLENRLIKDWQPAGNRKLKRTDRHVFLRCRLDIPTPCSRWPPRRPAATP